MSRNLNYLIMKADSFDVVKDVKQVGLDGVRVRGLAEDLQQGCVRDKKEARKQQPLLLQIAERQYRSLFNCCMEANVWAWIVFYC